MPPLLGFMLLTQFLGREMVLKILDPTTGCITLIGNKLTIGLKLQRAALVLS